MATIKKEDFKGEGLSLNDFTLERERFIVNDNSASQIAATETILSGGSTEDYRHKKEKLTDPIAVPSFSGVPFELQQAVQNDAKAGAQNLAADETASDEDRLFALDVLSNKRTITPTNNLQILAEESIAAGSGLETEEASELRGGLIDSIPRMVAQKMDAQRKINEYRLANDPSFLGTVGDVAELMLPYAEWIHYERLANQLDVDVSDFALLGNVKDALFKHLRSLPVEDRALVTDALIKTIDETSQVVFGSNDLVAIETLHNMLLSNDYSEGEKWFDNFTSVLDIAGVGGALRLAKGAKIPKALDDASPALKEALEDLGSRVDTANRTTRTEVSPTSPSQTVKDHNPEEARKLHKMVAEGDEETAKALYGTNKTDAMANDILPEPQRFGGPLKNKTSLPRPVTPEPADIKAARTKSGNTAFTDAERAKVNARLTADVKDIEGMRLHKESLGVSTKLDDTINITARYSPIDSGFKSAARAISNAKFAFRQYGLEEDQLSLFFRSGDEWLPISANDLKAKAELRKEFTKKKKKIPEELKDFEYSVGIEFDYRIKPEDLEVDELLETGNFLTRTLDAIPTQGLARAQQGSLVQNLLDPSSVIAPRIVNPASVQVDRTIGIKKLYVEQFEEFGKNYSSLKADRRDKMADYIHEANFDSIPFDVTDLRARGFNSDEIAALKQWRKANDAMWYAANDDMVKTLRASGTKAFVHDDSGTKLFGRKVPESTAKNIRQAYNPVSDAIESLPDDLYKSGGEVIKLNDPIKIGDQWVDNVISKNTPAHGYTRPIYDGETVLAYREGYYPVMYDANWFVEMQIKKAGGETGVKVVGASQTLKEAKALISRLKETEGPDVKFNAPRQDRRAKQDKGSLFDEGSWSMASNSGLTSQRLRGELLEDASGGIHKMGRTHLKDPLRAVAEQVQSLSQRVAMRDVLQTFKNRWMQNYAEEVGIPINPKTGKRDFPNSIGEIKGKSDTKIGMTADARTNFNYIKSLENGYINLIDEAYKASLNTAAEFFGKMGLTALEKGTFKISGLNPTQRAKILAFRFFIAGNPLRQALIQRGQMLQIGAVNPKYLAKDMMQDLAMIRLASRGFLADTKYAKLWDEIKDSGVLEAVDAHTLIRDDMLKLADLNVAEKAASIAGVPLKGAQKIGFDWAEQDVLLSSWLAHRDLAKRAGKNLRSQRVKDEILGQARAFTLNMNRSGDMAYNQNTLGLIAQFFSFRHKALLQPLTNKSISKGDKAKLAMWTTAMFGWEASIYGAIVASVFGDSKPSEVKQILADGLLDTTFNSVATTLSGENQNVDWGDFAPAEAYGIGNIWAGMLSSDLGEIIANSPGGSLIVGHNPRVTDAFKTALRAFYPSKDYQTENLKTTYYDVAKASLSMFSGFSNAFKANYAFQTRKKLSATGRITDEDMTAFESLMVLGGFQTKTEVGYREARDLLYKDRDFSSNNDYDLWYKELKRHITRKGITPRDVDMVSMVMAEAMEVWGDDRPKVIRRIFKNLEKDAADGDFKMFEAIYKQMGLMKDEDLWKIINKLPNGEERQRLTDLLNQREEMLNGN